MFAKCDHRNQETAPTLITMDVTDANAALNPGLIPISLQALGMQNVETERISSIKRAAATSSRQLSLGWSFGPGCLLLQIPMIKLARFIVRCQRVFR